MGRSEWVIAVTGIPDKEILKRASLRRTGRYVTSKCAHLGVVVGFRNASSWYILLPSEVQRFFGDRFLKQLSRGSETDVMALTKNEKTMTSSTAWWHDGDEILSVIHQGYDHPADHLEIRGVVPESLSRIKKRLERVHQHFQIPVDFFTELTGFNLEFDLDPQIEAEELRDSFRQHGAGPSIIEPISSGGRETLPPNTFKRPRHCI